jgi:hypothetical protein
LPAAGAAAAGQRRYTGWNYYGIDTSTAQAAADALHTGRERMPSPSAVILFLGCYLAALGPGAWWLRRRLGGGLVGIPITLGVAFVFMVGAIVFGLATRGLALATQRVTFLWPVPDLPLAAESTWFSCYVGLGQRVTVRFPGQVAPLTVDREGQFGTAGALRVRFGAEATEAVDFALGAWQTRVLCAEGARAIGGPVEVRGGAGAAASTTVTNRSALPLGRGVLWRTGSSHVVAVPPVAAGGTATALDLDAPSPPDALTRLLGLPEPRRFRGADGILAPLHAAGRRLVRGEDGTVTVATEGRVLYIAEVDPALLPGGGPTVAGETRLTDRVFVVVPVGADVEEE